MAATNSCYAGGELTLLVYRVAADIKRLTSRQQSAFLWCRFDILFVQQLHHCCSVEADLALALKARATMSAPDNSQQPQAGVHAPEETWQQDVITWMRDAGFRVKPEYRALLILRLDDAAVEQHNPQATAQQSRAALVDVVTAAGMQRINSVQTSECFRGSRGSFIRALNALYVIPWTRRQPGMPDVGELWDVQGRHTSAQFFRWPVPFN